MEAHIVEIAKWVFMLVITTLIAIGGFMAKALISDLRSLEKELDDHKLYSANNYVSKSEFVASQNMVREEVKSTKTELLRAIERLEVRLDNRKDS